MNLGIETNEIMNYYHYTSDDIMWIGGYRYTIDIDKFWAIAHETDYDNGYGAQHIAMDLKIVFKDGCWLSRNEYDGSEKWYYNNCPQKPIAHNDDIYSLGDNDAMWETLDEIN